METSFPIVYGILCSIVPMELTLKQQIPMNMSREGVTKFIKNFIRLSMKLSQFHYTRNFTMFLGDWLLQI